MVRDHAGRLAAALVRLTGDFAAAEDLVQDAVLAALEHWPVEGIPDRPDAWLFTVARRRGRRQAPPGRQYRAKLAELRPPAPAEQDERLQLIFTCCHPALPQAAQVALTLRVVCGLTTAQIARAFLHAGDHGGAADHPGQAEDHRRRHPVPDPARTSSATGWPGARLSTCCSTRATSSTAARPHSRDLTDDAEWLAGLLHRLMPTEPEVAGLLALIQLHRARVAARFDGEDGLVLLAAAGPVAVGPGGIAEATGC